MGYFPFIGSRRTECKQGRNRRTAALHVQGSDTGEEQEIVIENTESRSQMGNRENAMRLLRSQLYEIELENDGRHRPRSKQVKENRMGFADSQLRFRRQAVKDHRTNYQTSDVNGVMDGDLMPSSKPTLWNSGIKLNWQFLFDR